MIIEDRIYGRIEIKDKLIIDLINSKPLQRLKNISQDGATHFIQPIRNVTRYEHSIGAWYLSKLYDRPVEEQIATLLHDTPHTAFSHVIDFVMENEKHEFHDAFTKEIIMNSEIPTILKKHNIELEKVLHKESFPLLDNELPDISFDRWDYFMRDGHSVEMLPKQLIDLFLGSIKEKNQVFYFADVSIASVFSILFMNFSRLIWLDPISHGSFFLLSSALKIALQKKFLTESDLFNTEDYVLSKLKKAKNTDINALLKRLQPGNEFVYSSKVESEFYGSNKPRIVDPYVLSDNELIRVSNLVPSLSYAFEEFQKQYKYIGIKSV